jgi:ABC-type cobalamin transport system ATPase subunit
VQGGRVPKIAHPFYDDVRVGLEEKIGELGVEFQWIAPPAGNPAEQVQILEDLINKGVLILDEPTRGIDVGAKAEVHVIMARLAEQGVGILMISSELPEVLGMSDRILVMHEGCVTGEFTRNEVTRERIMLAATGTVVSATEAAR